MRASLPRYGPSRRFDGFADAQIGSAAADVAGHTRVDIAVRGVRQRVDKGDGGHDLTRLAEATLHDLQIEPCVLHRLPGWRRANPFDGGDVLSCNVCSSCQTRAAGLSIDVDGACAALTDTAAEFRAGHSKDIADNPKKGHLFRHVDRNRLLIQPKLNHP